MGQKDDLWLIDWVDDLQSKGRYSFSLEMLQKELSNYTPIGLKRSLSRLSRKNKIISIHKGFYLIIPPQYARKGILPPGIYLDGLMQYLDRPYYLGLLNAAAYHGASHQQPQEFFVFTNFPVLRTTLKKGLKVNFISKKEIPTSLVESKKTESGYLEISNPALTAIDIIQFEKRIGGINRGIVLLNELVDVLKPESFTKELIQYTHVTTLQRLGYLLDAAIKNHALANALYNVLLNKEHHLTRTPLKASGPIKGYSSDSRWKVVVNTTIDTED